MKMIFILLLLAGFYGSQAHAGFWDDLKEKSNEAKKELLTEENKEKALDAAKEYVEENQDELKEKAEDLIKNFK